MRIAVRVRMVGLILMLPLAHASGQRVLVLPIPDTDRGRLHAESERFTQAVQQRAKALGISVVPLAELRSTLEAVDFGYDRGVTWSAADARALASLLRADEFLLSSIRPEGAGYRVVVRLHLQRDADLRQPLVDSVFRSASEGIDRAVVAYAIARKQLPGEGACLNAARKGDLVAATSAARDAIRAYPLAAIARYCLWNVEQERRATPTELLSVAREIIAIDSSGPSALAVLAESFRLNAQPDSAALITARIVRDRSRGGQVVVVNEFRNVDDALRDVDAVLVLHPRDVDLLRLRWLMLLAAKRHQIAVEEGDRLALLDTSFADTTYFIRQSYAYEALGQRAQALSFVERGLQKFPAHPALLDRKRTLTQR